MLSRPSPVPAVRERLVPVPGGALFVREAGGAGEVVLAVHGGPGISHGPLQVLETMAGPGRVVVNYDQRGVGRSSGTVDPANLLEQALADLEAVRRSSWAERVHLLGHAWGGLLAALYAARFPQAVASLILVDSIPPTSLALQEAGRTYDERLRGFQRRGLVPAELPAWDEDATGRMLALLPICFVDPAHPAARTLGGARWDAAVWAAHRPTLRAYDAREAVTRVVAPSLHFIAPVPFGPAMSIAMAEAMTASARRRVHLRDAGHLPWLEQPLPFRRELERFLDSITNP